MANIEIIRHPQVLPQFDYPHCGRKKSLSPGALDEIVSSFDRVGDVKGIGRDQITVEVVERAGGEIQPDGTTVFLLGGVREGSESIIDINLGNIHQFAADMRTQPEEILDSIVSQAIRDIARHRMA